MEKSNLYRTVVTLLFLVLLPVAGHLRAATFYWDADENATGNATDGTGLGGSGNWDTSTANWWNGAADSAWPNTNADLAIFTAAFSPGAPVLNTVTLASDITANMVSFLRSGYTLTGGELTLAGTTPTLHATLGDSATISSLVDGTDGLTMTGGGTIRLANNANTYTGVTSIANGTLIISSQGALGADSSAVVITTGNDTPSNTSLIGFTGGSLVLDGTAAGFTFSRDLNIEGQGPIGGRGAAVLSLGNNTLSGTVTSAVSPLVPTSFRNSRLSSINGTLTLSGTVTSQGTSGTTFLTLGGINTAGVGSFNLTGIVTGTGSIEKAGAGTLFLNPSSTSGFTGTLRISASATGQQSSVRVTQLTAGGTSVFGANTVANDNNSAIDMNGGVLEFRFDGDLDFGSLASGKNVHLNDSSTFYTGPAVGGSAVNGLTTLGTFRVDTAETATFNSRNGFGFTLGAWTQESSNGDTTITNSLGGTLTFTGNAWNNSDGSNRTLTIGGNGNTRIIGSIDISGAGLKTLTKTGSGSLTIEGVGTDIGGSVNANGGAIVITDFRSLNNNTATINIGTGGTAGALIIGTGVTPTIAGLTTSKVINLAGTTGGASIYANQTGANPVILNGDFTTTGGAATNSKTLTLGGTNAADNIINGSIENQSVATSGAVSVTKIGSGTWVLAGENLYTGTTTIVDGTLKLKANAATSTILGSSNDITFGNSNTFSGGTLEFVGQDGVNNVQTLNVLTTTSGASTIRLTPGFGGTASLTFASQSTGAAGTVNFVGADFVNNQITITGANGLISRTNYWEGADFAYRESNVLRAPVYGTDAGFVTSLSDLTAAANMEITGSFAADTVSISTLKIAGSHTLTLNAAQTLTLSAGGVLVTGGDAVITGGAALALGSQALVVRTDLAGDSLDIQSVVTGSGGLTKGGAGTLILSGVNAQTGTVTINEGTVQLSGSGRLAANNVSVTMRQGATIDLNGVTPSGSTNSWNSNGVLTNSSATAVTFNVGGSNGTGTSFGTFTETNGIINILKSGSGAQSWLGLSNYTGSTTIGSTGLVTVDVLADGGEASGIGASTNAASNLVFSGSTGGLVYAGVIRDINLALGSRSASTDRLFTLSGSGATLSSTAANFNAIVWSNTGAIVHGTDQDRTLIFTGTSQGDNTFNPQLTDPTGFATSISKTGTGIWRLGNINNTYSGSTTITQGILMATDGQGLSSLSNLIFDGGTLYSQGTLSRDIGTGAGQMQFAAPANANEAEFIGGFLGGDSKLTVSWTGTPVWGSTAGFISERDGLILNGSQARAQGATGSIALSEVEITGDFSLGIASATGKTIAVTTANSSATGTVTTGDTSGLVVGQSITGPNIASGAYIVSINSATTFTMSANASTATATNRDLIANNLRAIRVDDNANTGADFATISGVISAGDSVTGLRKVGTGILKLTGANTYEGETNVNQGTLVVTSLGLSGSAGTSSVGAVTVAAFGNANALTLGNGGTGGGILQYIGAGETSDRKIRLNSTTGSNQIHSDGSGPLILTNVANDMVAGAKTLFLRGSNAAGNMITSQLSDNGGTLSVTVDGSATWILTNPGNIYTGSTTAGAGALGIGDNAALGTGTLIVSNANVFAYGADRTISNPLQFNSATSHGFIGDYSLTFTGALAFNASTSSSNFTNNSIVSGKTLTFGGGVTANSLTATRNWQFDGPGETIINGDFTTSTAFGVNIIKTGNGILTLGTSGATSNWNQAGNNVDVDRGTLKFAADNAIPTASAANGGLTISPEVLDVNTATADTATVDFNGTTQTVNALTATSNGILVLDNTSATDATFRFGANDSAVNFGSGIGTYTVQNTGAGALSLVKLGNTAATFISGITLGHKGITASEGGGSFAIASPVTATTGLRAIEGSALILSGGLPNGNLVTSIEVGGGSTLSLLDGAGSQFSNLTTLNLGNTGVGTVTLNLNVGDLNTNTDRLNTDTLTLLTGGTLNLGETITFNMNDAGLNANQTYTLLDLEDGGLTAFGLGNLIQGATPGGFDSFTWFVDDNVVQLTTGNLIVGDLYWRGTTDTTWNANADNWSLNKDGTGLPASIPGQGTRVIFAYDGVGTAALTTTLEQNIKINSLVFEAGATTPSSVTINPGTVATSRLEIAPSSSANGVTITTGGPAAVTIGANLKLGADQTWNVVDSASTLTLSGALFGEADVTKSGDGKVILSAASDPTFNAGQTADFTVAAGNLELIDAAALGTLANSNLVNIDVSGGGFYYNNATSGTIVNPLALSGGTLSAGRAAGGAAVIHTYSGTVNISGNSFINLRDSNSATTSTVANNIILSGEVSGSGALTVSSDTTTLVGGNAEGGTLTINNAGSTWFGDLTFTSGSVDITAAASATVTPGDITFDGFGRLIVRGLNGQTINRADTLTFTAGAIGEYLLDNTSSPLGADFVVNQNGQVNIGSGGTGASARFTIADAATTLNIAGGVVLGGDSSISVDGGDADSLVIISGVISDGGSGYALAINDDAGGWAVSNNNIRLTGANTFTGNLSLSEGILEFDTVTNISGGASALGNGSALTVGGATLSFIGTTSQATDRPITQTGTTTFSANGTAGVASITYNGAITGNTFGFVLTGAAGSEGFITSGITNTGATDATVNGGTWTLTGASTVGDDFNVSGTGTILNLNSTGALTFTAGASTSAALLITNGATVNLGADGAITAADFDNLFIAQNAGGAIATLDMNTFNLTTSRFILGERLEDREGLLDGTGTLTVTGGDIDLYRGIVNANFVTTGTGTFEKFGPGTVTLKGDNSGLASTGDTIINEGTLVFDYTVSNTTKVKANEPLSMVGSNLVLNGNNSAATVQNVLSFTLGSGGNSVINLNPGTGQDIVLNLNAITRAVNGQDGTIRFNLPTGTQSATNGITTDSLNTIGTGANAILGGWATVNDGTGVFFARNVTNAANGNLGIAITTTQDAVASWLAGENITDSTGFTGTLGQEFTLNSLRFDAASGSGLALGTAGHLRLTSGGILVTSNVGGTPSITGGTLDSMAFTLPVAVNDIIVTHDSASSFEISSSIHLSNNLVKSGSGTLLLSGTNGYSGFTEIQNGTLQLSGGNAIGDNSFVTLAANRNTTLELLADETIGRLGGGKRATNSEYGTVAVGTHTLTLNQSGGTTTFAGLFTGTGGIVFSETSVSTLNMQNNSSGFTGTVVVNGGLFQLSNIGRNDASSFTINGNGMMLIDNNGSTVSTTRILDSTPIILNSAAGGGANIRGLWVRNTDSNASRFETIGDLMFNSGTSYLTGEANDAGATENGRAGIIASNFVRNDNATFSVRGRNLGTTLQHHNQFRIAAANEAAFIAGLIGGGDSSGATLSILPWAIGETHNNTTTAGTNMGNSLVTYVAGAGLRPLDFTTDYADYATAGDTNNTRETLSVNLTGLAGRTLNALVINNEALGALDFTGLGVGELLTNTSGAFLFTLTGGANDTAYSTILGGFDDGIETPSGEYVFHVVNPSAAATTPTLTATVASGLDSAADITKSGRGTLIFTAVNAAGGGANKTTLNEGTLEITDLDNIGGGTGGLVFAGGTLRLGAGFIDDISTRAVSFLAGGATLDTNGNNLVLANSIGGGGAGGFTKIGEGDLTLSVAASYSGATQFTNGTLTLGVDDALPSGTILLLNSGTTAATLDMNGFNQTLGALINTTNSALLTTQVVIDVGTTLTVNGPVLIGTNTAAGATTLFTATGGGSFVQNQAGGTFQLGGATGGTNTNAASADFSGLANFTVDLGPTGIFRLGDNNTPFSPTSNSTLTLASVSNTITTGILGLGDAQGQSGTLTLALGGGTNTINADTVYIGAATPSARGAGALVFGGAGGTLTLRGSSGGTSRADVAMTTSSISTSASSTNTFLLAGHSVDVLIDSFVMSERTTNSGSVTSTFTFDTGTLDITSLTMSRRSGAGTGDSTSTVTLDGGTATIGSIDMAASTGTGSGSDAVATLNISGGDVSIGTGSGTAVNLANAGTGRTVTSNVNLTGGTVTVTGNIIRTGGAGTENETLTLNGSTLDMSANSIGDVGTDVNFAAESGTLTNLAELNGGGVLDKTTVGTLTLTNGNTYTGGTTVTAGILLAMNTTGSATGTGNVTVLTTGTLGGTGSVAGNVQVDSGGTLAPGASAGQLTVAGSLNIDAGGTLLAEIGGATYNDAATIFTYFNANGQSLAGLTVTPDYEDYQVGVTQHDNLNVTGGSVPTIDGTLTFGPVLNAYVPQYGDIFDLVDWAAAGSIAGTTGFDFSAVTLSEGLGFNTELFASHGLIVVVPEPSRALFMMLGLLGLMLRRRR